MRHAALCWALLTLAWAGSARRQYCERADVAWRAYRAPAAFEARVQSLARDAATVRVQRVLRRQGHWPRDHSLIRLKLPPPDPRECSGRFEVPLRNRRNFIVFAERHGHAAVALGPPLRRTGQLVKRIRTVYEPGYSECLVASSGVNAPYGNSESYGWHCRICVEKGSPARVDSMSPARVKRGEKVKLECKASGRPPPRITWYKDGRPVADIGLRRFRVQNFRRRSVLVIRHARLEDSASYECRAQGAVGPPAVSAANVSVLPPPTPEPENPGAPCPMPDPASYCLNGGTCLYFEQVQEQACKCPEGFNGQRCENKDISNRSNMDEPLWMSRTN